MGKLDGKVAIITGAGRGHAEAIAKVFAKEGAAVAICDIIPLKELENTVGSIIKAEGGKVLCFQTDVSKEKQVNRMVEQTVQEFDAVDILVNSVGIAGLRSIRVQTRIYSHISELLQAIRNISSVARA
jgi:NAD(P)-dependent dehydrogenase (short-subunit alcohol dehydrogenase family)